MSSSCLFTRAARPAILLATLISIPASAQTCPSATPRFADEFNGTAVDTSKWEMQIGDGCSYGICGWGNNELQSYQAANATVANGLLTITAKKQRIGSKNYTSARMRTLNMPNSGQWTHGRFEARIKTPSGSGMWSAFWMLPSNTTVGWPMSGEIDIQEGVGQKSMFQLGTIHYGPSNTEHQFLTSQILKQPDTWADDFHVYAIEWTPNRINWYVDDLLFASKTPADLANPADWTFENYQYHLILNLAVGGNLGGTVDDSQLPQTMQVDYVRSYAAGQPSISGKHLVEPNSTATYAVVDEGSGASYAWSAPGGQSGTTKSFAVNWGSASGPVSVTVTNSCGSYTKKVDVTVAPALSQSAMLDDFEASSALNYTTVTGSFDQVSANPAPDGVNGSSVVGKYVRNSTQAYDLITATSNAVTDAGPYLRGEKAVYLDVYTSAPPGTPMLVQFENNRVATASNYPSGRHSKYLAHTTSQSGWQRLKFVLEERIDGNTPDSAVNQLVMLFNPNTLTGDTYYIDNVALYGSAGDAAASTMRVSSVVNGTVSAPKGRKYASATVTVLNNNGQPVANATVTGDFSGTINESGVSGVTGSDGKVLLKTSTSSGGTISNTFCVSSVSAADLTFDSGASVSTCP